MSNGNPPIYTLRAEAYARSRPTYPSALLDIILTILGNTGSKQIADIGSGTGLLSELLLELGHKIIAVEPSDQMRMIAEGRLAGNPLFTSVGATAEETTLPNHSVDLVAIGQALHWFDLDRAKKEFRRILRGQRKAIVVYNHRKLTGDAFHQELENALLHLCPNYKHTRHVEGCFDNLLNRFFENGARSTMTMNNNQTLSASGLVDRFASISCSPLPSDPAFPEFGLELRSLHQKHAHNGEVTLKYCTGIYWGIVAEGR